MGCMGLSAWIQRCSVFYCAVLYGCDCVFVSFVYSYWVGGVCCVLGRPLEPRRPELSQTRLLPSWWLWPDTGEGSQDLKRTRQPVLLPWAWSVAAGHAQCCQEHFSWCCGSSDLSGLGETWGEGSVLGRRNISSENIQCYHYGVLSLLHLSFIGLSSS